MQGKRELSALESQLIDTRQRLHTAQAAVRKQSQLLHEERASISQQAELVAIETLEATVQRIQEVCRDSRNGVAYVGAISSEAECLL